MRSNSMERTAAVLLGLAMVGIAAAPGCGRKQAESPKSVWDAKWQKMVNQLEGKPAGTGFTPEKAAEITHAVSQVSLSELPSGKNLPKAGPELTELNNRIRSKAEKVYIQHGTTMSAVMQYLRDLSPKDRERYNRKLTELFLAEARKKK